MTKKKPIKNQKILPTRISNMAMANAHGKGVIDLPNGFYKIIDGIPIPTKTRMSLIETKFSFLKEMPVNDTKVVRFEDKKLWSSALIAANNYGKKANKTFTGRTIPPEQGGGFGIWRIK